MSKYRLWPLRTSHSPITVWPTLDLVLSSYWVVERQAFSDVMLEKNGRGKSSLNFADGLELVSKKNPTKTPSCVVHIMTQGNTTSNVILLLLVWRFPDPNPCPHVNECGKCCVFAVYGHFLERQKEKPKKKKKKKKKRGGGMWIKGGERRRSQQALQNNSNY